jgi:hypothetical protein
LQKRLQNNGFSGHFVPGAWAVKALGWVVPGWFQWLAWRKQAKWKEAQVPGFSDHPLPDEKAPLAAVISLALGGGTRQASLQGHMI